MNASDMDFPEVVKTGKVVITAEAGPDPPQSVSTLCGELAARLCPDAEDRNALAETLQDVVEQFFYDRDGDAEDEEVET